MTFGGDPVASPGKQEIEGGFYTEDHGLTSDELRAWVDALLVEDWSSLPDLHAVDRLGRLVDAAHHTNREDAARAAIDRAEALLARTLAPSTRAIVHYFLANAWSAVHCATSGHHGGYAWDVPEVAHQIIHLRHALRAGAGMGAGEQGREARFRYCQVATNLGNLMSECGRIVDAVAYWDAALAADPEFTMARGNRGYGLVQYAQVVHDPGHQALHRRAAHADLVRATAPEMARRAHADAQAHFVEVLAALRAHVPAAVLEHPHVAYQFPKRMPGRERAYREWCLQHRLFLNDLNDLGAAPVAASDVLVLPDLTTPLNAGRPNAIGFFNQLKQEFVAARFLYYRGITSNAPHFSDRGVMLFNTLDYPAYGLAVEEVKAAFRIAYSLFDKIAFFLNDYLQLGIAERNVSFRGLWYEQQKPSLGLRAEVHRPENGPLKGLFWLSKDLYESDPRYREALEPDARETATVRNHLEHKYFKLHLFGPPEPPEAEELRTAGEALAYSLGRDEFERRTLRLLVVARAALIYLSQAVYVEEERRRRALDPGEKVMPVWNAVWDDRWKA